MRLNHQTKVPTLRVVNWTGLGTTAQQDTARRSAPASSPKFRYAKAAHKTTSISKCFMRLLILRGSYARAPDFAGAKVE
ncbi:hypothetical protein [Vibrio aerogenes]|uniref:hypothetical protein n=1 Tax=Vibrio aerogenes TaxID=92172 RepID=UPI000937A859|nr:hypothetical protein [Vibrio aerogenes]